MIKNGMQRHHTILLGIALVVLIAGIFLSLIRAKSSQNPSGEIKHFSARTSDKNHKKSAKLPVTSRSVKQDKIVQEKEPANPLHANIPLEEKPHSLLPSEEGLDNKPIEEPLIEEGVLITYRVVAGDSLLKLAKKYRTTAYQIAKRNLIAEDTKLKVGEELEIIPGEEVTYRVQEGESLSEIAQRFGADYNDIIALNDIKESGSIFVGQKLIMPVSQKRIDTVLAEIAKEKQEAIQRRKRQYQQQFLSRLKRQQMARAQALEAKKRAEQQAKAKKIARIKQKRLQKARHAFKYTSAAKYQHKMRVVATAYTSHRSQTDRTPFLAAWNNRIRPGMKIIAVSPDLIRKYGLTNGVRVKIGGLPGTYVVRDKMNARLHDHIDIYMGTNRRRALRWGRRRVVLYW